MFLSAYIPQDRLRALVNNSSLPDRTSGAALFADISGFTSLTDSLYKSLGSRRGAEELTRQLNAVYSALIAEVEICGGGVISFAGDAIICWFDRGKDELNVAASLALSAGMGMQRAIEAFPELSLKVAIASGNARRFVVGDPSIHLVDTIAGATVARISMGEILANKGEVLVDEATLNFLGDSLAIKEWRKEDGERFGVVKAFSGSVTEIQNKETSTLSAADMQHWVLRSIYERAETDSFMADFRPCAALFIRFTGLDYEADDAQTQLDIFIKQIQTIAERYEGVLLQLTIGDKGSYVYVNFGALSAHEDDGRRAVKAALELRNKTELQLQMGITQGLMRVGAYGGETRKAFGALGDDVNLAARLMTAASVNEILLTSNLHMAVAEDFTFEPHASLPMKGKAEPLQVFAVTGERKQRAIRLQEPDYALPMVGRLEELGILNDKLDAAAKGQGQVVAIVAEAGLGKSRLVAEVIRSARKKGFIGFGGACQSDAIHTPYQAWKSIWGAFFSVDTEMSLKKQMRLIEGEIEDRAPSRMEAMPLLNVVLDLNIPENEFTKNLEPKIRQSALHALLEDCLKAMAKDDPILIIIEDLHWIDALSHDLLEGLAKALANYRVVLLVAYRPPQLTRLETPRLEALAQFTKIELHELTQAEAESVVRAKLTQLYPYKPALGGALPAGLVDMLMARTQGNPFYLEELLNYVRDRGLDPADIQNIELPDSLHTLILSRIDQLSEQEKTTLRVASIVGRLFRAKWLTGYYPELGSFTQAKASLDVLEKLDITPLDSPEPELAYLFKHIVTHEVTYESLLFATRTKLHEQLARYLENADAPVETIAFHYGRSNNAEKQREYYRKAGEAAQKNFANDAAFDYFRMLLPLLKDAKEQIQIYLKRGQVHELIGNYDNAESDYRTALDSAEDDMVLKANAQYFLGRLNVFRGNYEPALDWLGQAKEARTKLEDMAGMARVLVEMGGVFYRKGEFVQAREPLNEGLGLARKVGDKLIIAQALNHLGLVADRQGDYTAAQALHEESLALRREMGEKVGISVSLNNLGNVTASQGDLTAARALHEESLVLKREMGHKAGIAMSLANLGTVVLAQGDNLTARASYEESLMLHREISDKWGIAVSLGNLGLVAYLQSDYSAARVYFKETFALCKEMDEKLIMAATLLGLGLVDLAENKPEAREHILTSLSVRQETGEQLGQTSSLIGMAGLALLEGNPHFAAQVLGAVESALKALKAVMEAEFKPFHDQTVARVKEQLGAAEFRSAWEEGAKWSLEETVKRVLEEKTGD